MSKIVSGKFIASTAAVNVECGFVPSYVKLISALGGTELEFEFFKILKDLAVAGQYGFTLSTTGVPGPASSGSGITTYDTKVLKALLPAPVGHNDKAVAVYGTYAYGIAQTKTPTARVAGATPAIGTVIRPTVSNGFLYECTVTNGAMAVEPTFPTKLGDSVTDSASNTWICRIETLKWVGVKGFTVEAGICTDGELWVFKAEEHDRFEDMGDADVENPVTFHS